ncbi:replication factor A [Halobacteriales archaeon SW_10_66_29]|nr:MAG: replication factor A [Halobacteriales archaeon SW_10_66_29]
MGAIEEIYADLETDVSEAEFREAVEQKVEQMEGLADEETAAMILAHELADSEVDTVADIDPAMDEVKFLAKVRSIGELRTFERDDGEGTVVNVEAADETGTARLAFWDERAEAATEELEVGDVLRVKGRPKEGYNGLEVSVDEAEPGDEVEIDIPVDDGTIESLTLGQSDVNLRGLVLGTDTVRTFERDDGSEGRVANLTLGDETGRIRVTLWDDMADRADEIDPGTAVEVVDGYVREREGDAEAELDERIDIAGVVRSTDPKRTFDRDDGSEGQVRNVRLQDDTDDIRVALWGPKADMDVAPGDELLAADAEIQDGWQDDLEASAGWQSTVVVLEDAATGGDAAAGGVEQRASRQSTGEGGASAGDDAVSDGGDSASLDSFADGTPADAGSEDGSTTGAERVEFTGTVVQTGEPVVLDDGTETMSVETDARLRLGEEVTVRGELVDERLDADELL